MSTTPRQSGFLIQSTFGVRGNFELVVPSYSQFSHYYRDNDDPRLPWYGPTAVFGSRGDGPSLIQGNFGANFEMVTADGGRLAHYWRANGAPNFPWNGPNYIGNVAVTSAPGLIQSTFGNKGNFEVLVGRPGTGMVHYSRNNDDPNLLWSGPTYIPTADTIFGVSLIQSNDGILGAVVVEGTSLAHYWRDNSANPAWHGPTYFASGIAGGLVGAPGFIQSSFGNSGNFEVVVPAYNQQGLMHYWRDNDDPQLPWYGPTAFGTGFVGHVALIQGNFVGNFEVVAIERDSLAHYWRANSVPNFPWNGPNYLPS